MWCYLVYLTAEALGKKYVAKAASASGYEAQMVVWHNLLAIWVWRYLFSAIDGVRDIIEYYLPSYAVWVTLIMLAMIGTTMTASNEKADTWYAKCLLAMVKQ